MTVFTPLDQPDLDIKRDRWGRPLITPPDGGPAKPYVRVSTLAKVLDDKTALTKWKQRMVATGIAARPDLAQLAAAVKGDKKRLDEVVEQAMAAAETSKAANVGTALHALTEHIDAGTIPDHVPDNLWPDLHAYEHAMTSIDILAMEQFVVNDTVEAAGTFDRLVKLPDGRIVVADIKTGQHENKYPHGVATQIAIYANSYLYHPDNGRTGHLPSLGVSTDTGLLIHLPAGQGTCTLYLLDLTVGWALAQTATAVRSIFKTKPITPYTPAPTTL